MFQNFYLGFLRLQNSLNKSTQYKIPCGETKLGHVFTAIREHKFPVKGGITWNLRA